jgi:hypothetical protein
MRITFLCRSLESGKDGVGDYCRRLAGELIRRGHACGVIALNDPYVLRTASADQSIEGTPVPSLRLPDSLSRGSRTVAARRWLEAFKPDWVSLQFVPYGFDPRGLCFGLGPWLKSINSQASWHVMFHELWLGLGENSPVKERLIGCLQRRTVLNAIGHLHSRVIHTHAQPYQIVLGREKIKADILPLFSNIPFAAGAAWDDVLKPLINEATGGQPPRESFYLAGVMGAVHGQWKAGETVATILPLARRFQKRLVLVFLGKNNLSREALNELRSGLRDQATVIVTGERPSTEISRILQTLDLGLATTPWQAIQKSGSAVAMLEHGLPVLVSRDDWRLRGADAPFTWANSQILTPQQFGELNALPMRDAGFPCDHGVKDVAGQLVAALTTAAAQEPAALAGKRPTALLADPIS